MKRNVKSILALIAGCVCISHTVFSSGPEVDVQILQKLNEYCLKTPYEDIYIQTDRDYYVSGEDMWFRVFATDRQSRKLSLISRVAYCELLNPDNIPVIQKRIILDSGTGPGYIFLPDTLRSGDYTLRIYTNIMRDFLPVNCFMKNITIFNPFSSRSFKRKIICEKISDKDFNVTFFPEGGTLIDKIPSRIGVRVTDRYQRGIRFTGIIKNNAGDSVTFFTTDESGIGSFDLVPAKGSEYFISSDGYIAYLPDVAAEGFSLRADNSDKDLLSIRVSLKENPVKQSRQVLLLFIHTRGIENYSEFFRMTGEEVKITIPKTALLPGINHITLFSDEGKPLCERLIFTREAGLPASDLPVNDIFTRREKAEAELDLSHMAEKSSVRAELSVSVVPVNSVSNSVDMEDYLVFGTEFGLLPVGLMKDGIRKTDDVPIDEYLITAESRWLSWDKILSDNPSDNGFLPESDGYYLTGLVRKRDSEETVPGQVLYLSIPGKTATFQYSITDNSGQFRFLLPADYSGRDLIIQPATPDEGITIQIKNPFAPESLPSVTYTDTIRSTLPEFISDFSTGYQVDKIYNITHRKDAFDHINQPWPKVRFYGIPETEIKMDDYIRLPLMQEIFFELTPGIKLRSRKSGYEMRINNPVDNIIYEKPPLVLIDGVVINDLSVLADLDPERVDRIDAVRTPYLTGGLIHYGIVNVITRKGNFENITLPDYVARMTFRVADPVPEFISPDYLNIIADNKRIPDFRNTIYWDPCLKPDAQGKVHVRFRTSDRSGDYVINIQGITGDGKPISVRKMITVK